MVKYSDQVKNLIRKGVIVCPISHAQLHHDGDVKLTASDGTTFPITPLGVPILLENPEEIQEYSTDSSQMTKEYTEKELKRKESSIRKLYHRLFKNTFSSEALRVAMQAAFEGLNEEAVCISVGGGPARGHDRLLNMNIGPFPNVDIVGDAHKLPFASESVDVVHSDAVFEHLHTPWVAAAEIARVLKSGGKALIHTPFLQPYHGYPHHYQNFTITGHKLLFEREGLQVISSGVGVGPTFVFRKLGVGYFNTYLPKPIALLAKLPWFVITRLMAPLDLIINKRDDAHIYASTTFVLVEKL